MAIIKIIPVDYHAAAKIDELILSGKLTHTVFHPNKRDEDEYYEMRVEDNVFLVHTEKYLRGLFYDLFIDATIK